MQEALSSDQKECVGPRNTTVQEEITPSGWQGSPPPLPEKVTSKPACLGDNGKQ